MSAGLEQGSLLSHLRADIEQRLPDFSGFIEEDSALLIGCSCLPFVGEITSLACKNRLESQLATVGGVSALFELVAQLSPLHNSTNVQGEISIKCAGRN